MSISFDLTCLLYLCDLLNNTCSEIGYFFQGYMGLVVTLWTNVIVSIVYYLTFIYFEINIVSENFNILFTCFHLFGITVGVLNTVFYSKGYYHAFYIILSFYNCFRLLSIAYNFIVIGLTCYKIKEYDKNNPIREFSNRIILYPIIQIITFAP